MHDTLALMGVSYHRPETLSSVRIVFLMFLPSFTLPSFSLPPKQPSPGGEGARRADEVEISRLTHCPLNCIPFVFLARSPTPSLTTGNRNDTIPTNKARASWKGPLVF